MEFSSPLPFDFYETTYEKTQILLRRTGGIHAVGVCDSDYWDSDYVFFWSVGGFASACGSMGIIVGVVAWNVILSVVGVVVAWAADGVAFVFHAGETS